MPLLYTNIKSDVGKIEKSSSGLGISNRVISDILFNYVDLESLKEKMRSPGFGPGFLAWKAKVLPG